MVPGMAEQERLATGAYRQEWLAGTDAAPARRPATLTVSATPAGNLPS